VLVNSGHDDDIDDDDDDDDDVVAGQCSPTARSHSSSLSRT